MTDIQKQIKIQGFYSETQQNTGDVFFTDNNPLHNELVLETVVDILYRRSAECKNHEFMILSLRFVSQTINKLLRLVEERVVRWPLKINKLASFYCAGNGYLALMKWAFKTLNMPLETKMYSRTDKQYNACTAASACGHLDVVKWAAKHGCSLRGDDMALSAATGPDHRAHERLQVLDWMDENGHGPSEVWYFKRALYCHSYEVVKWAFDRKNNTEAQRESFRGELKQLLPMLAADGRLDILKLAAEQGCFAWNTDVAKSATLAKRVEVLQWVLDQDRYTFPSRLMMMWSAESGCMDTFSWASNHRERFEAENKDVYMPVHLSDALVYTIDRNPSVSAACGGNIEILKRTVLLGYPLTEEVMSAACTSGNLEMVQWARQNGCPWDENTMRDTFNHFKDVDALPMIQWMHANGWRWGVDTLFGAAQGHHYETYAWIRDNTAALEDDDIHHFARKGIDKLALANGHFWRI